MILKNKRKRSKIILSNGLVLRGMPQHVWLDSRILDRLWSFYEAALKLLFFSGKEGYHFSSFPNRGRVTASALWVTGLKGGLRRDRTNALILFWKKNHVVT